VIAALFVEKGGVYYGLPDVDPWDEERDARKYAGPWPVVAHPPCQRWGSFAALNFKRYGGEHNRPGNDGGCFASALESVRRFGGVLEHPAGSKAWGAYGIVLPSEGSGWIRSLWIDEWTCEVWQSAYGHKARKRTWLLYSGRLPPLPISWTRRPGTHQVGHGFATPASPGKKPLSSREACATPLAFRDELLSLARRAVRTF